MIRIVVAAKYIKEGTQVMKPSGTYKYTLHKDGLRVYMKEAGRANHEVLMKGVFILQK